MSEIEREPRCPKGHSLLWYKDGTGVCPQCHIAVIEPTQPTDNTEEPLTPEQREKLKEILAWAEAEHYTKLATIIKEFLDDPANR